MNFLMHSVTSPDCCNKASQEGKSERTANVPTIIRPRNDRAEQPHVKVLGETMDPGIVPGIVRYLLVGLYRPVSGAELYQQLGRIKLVGYP